MQVQSGGTFPLKNMGTNNATKPLLVLDLQRPGL